MDKIKEIEHFKGSLTKYSNRAFPKFVPEHWVVWEDENNGKTFRRFEEAVIYKKLLEIEIMLNKGKEETEKKIECLDLGCEYKVHKCNLTERERADCCPKNKLPGQEEDEKL